MAGISGSVAIIRALRVFSSSDEVNLSSLLPEGKCVLVGVAGRTLMVECGDRADRLAGLCRPSMLFEDTDEALLCVVCLGMLLIDESDEDVDLRPRNPVELRR